MIKIKNKNKYKFDYVLFTLILLLSLFGLIILYSASYNYSLSKFGDSSYIFKKQVVFFLMGYVILFIFSNIDYYIFYKFSKYIYIAALLMVIFITFGSSLQRGVNRWITIYGFSFQPSELMKFAMILYLPRIFIEMEFDFSDRLHFYMLMFLIIVPIMIIATNNLSTSFIVFLLSTSMIYLVSKKHIVFIIIFLSLVLIYIFLDDISIIMKNIGLIKNYQLERLLTYKNPKLYRDNSFQTVQGLYAVASGKIIGRGLFSSIQKAIVPEAQNDMIFAILSEELGLLGDFIVITLYIMLIAKIFISAAFQKDAYTFLVLVGIGLHLAIQVMFNIAVATNLMPNTGVTLPFISYGGSAIIVLFMEMGLVMQVIKSNG